MCVSNSKLINVTYLYKCSLLFIAVVSIYPIFVGSVSESGSPSQQRDLSGLVGETIQLPCSVNTEKCGELHSIKWYRGSSRIFVFSEMAKISKAEGDYVDRAELQYTGNSTESHLTVKRLQVGDEANYKCEITYLEVREGCQVVQFINLTTLIKPEYLKITKDDTNEIQNGTKIGPLTEHYYMTLTCESGGGKPIPSVQWWKDSELLTGDYESEPSSNGIGLGRNKVKLTVGRQDLGAKYECRANNDALTSPMRSWLELEVNVRPLDLKLTGQDKVVQGTKLVMECHAVGARPPANITWFNGTDPIPSNSTVADQRVPHTKVINNPDGTYDTRSELIFEASRYEDEQSLTCEAINDVMKDSNDGPLRQTLTLEVLFPPIVTVHPKNKTVMEGAEVMLFCEYEANPSTLLSIKWMRNDEEVVLNPDHFEGGTIEQTTITIKNSTRYDHGLYTCVLENEVGASESDNSVFVSVQFKPIVNLTMIPSTPVSELDEENITLVCEVVAGNPDTLIAVRWYLDGELLKELPDCSTPNSSFCDVDPSKLLLEQVGRSFHGNYSCVGKNDAGWGPISPDTELIVHYPPGPATLIYSPSRVVKKGSLTLSCSVKDPGRPDNTTFRWIRGSHPVHDATLGNWTIDPVMLETESNFTCIAVNLGGESKSATQYIKVFAPPTFIERLPPYSGALMTLQYINMSCRVECSPICSINWQKNGMKLDTGPHSRYYVHNTVIPPDPRTNDFESVQSTLIWNMTAWPGGQLDRITDNANYTCQSTGNAVGSGVKSLTFFGVEYPPENLTVSNKVVNVIEGNTPDRVICSAKAFPQASYQWKREGESDIIIKGNALILGYPVPRRNGGNYVCEAHNKHGNNTITTLINVLYKPECGITQSEIEGKLVLICSAHANPTEVDFTWKIKNENETIEENIEKNGLQSLLKLETRVENFRTYLCFANNSVGMSIPCEHDVTGNIGWWRRFENDNLMILVAIIAGVIVMVLIICVIIILVCRRKRASDKYPNPSTTKDKSDLNSSPNDALLQPENDRAFYENLPFHGMQNPPNKSTSVVNGTTQGESRPPSELSQYAGSSGYGSTRSRTSPRSKYPRPELILATGSQKFLTVRPGKRPRNWPQFRSLRIPKKSAMDPLKESSPDSKKENNNNNTENTVSEEGNLSIPIPAPRHRSPDVTKHTYQNVPLPKMFLVPNTEQKTEIPSNNEIKIVNENQHCQLTNQSLDRHKHLLNSTTSNGRHSLKKKKSQQCIRQNSGRDEYVYPTYRSTQQLPSPPPPPPNYLMNNGGGGILYSDLPPAHHRSRPSLPHIPLYAPPISRNHTEYAMIKFHDVGQEIDV